MIVDMHCHILPGVDDGPATMEESLATLKEAQRQGIGAMIVTPHFHPGRYMVTAEQALASLERVKRHAAAEGLKIKLYPGQECYYYSGLLEQLEAGNVLTMNGTDYVLVEFEPETQYSTITFAIRELIESGYIPIIAHYERYSCLYQRWERLEELRKHGAMFQLNFSRLIDKGSFLRPNIWRKLLKDGYVDFLGSDTHGMKFRPLRITEAVEWLKSDVRSEIRNRILVHNISLLIPTGYTKTNH